MISVSLEECLFDETELGFTRGVSLLNLARLCTYAFQQPMQQIRATELGRTAERNGLREFRGFSSRNVIPTRARHCWYSLETLHLMRRGGDRRNPVYDLLEAGRQVAEVVLAEHLPLAESSRFLPADYVASVSDGLRNVFTEVLVKSEYMREVWLSLFMDGSEFGRADLARLNQPLLIEKLTPQYRVDLSGYGSKKKDSGYRIHPASKSAFERLTIAGNQGVRFEGVPADGIIYSETTRKEIHDSVRSWTYKEVGLTNETPLDIGQSEEEVIEGRRAVWVVTRYLPTDPGSTGRLAALVEGLIRSMGNGRRIRIPTLIVELCRSQRISLQNAKQILRQLHQVYSKRFYFEGASEQVIIDRFTSVPNPDDYYLIIDGIWRPTISLID